MLEKESSSLLAVALNLSFKPRLYVRLASTEDAGRFLRIPPPASPAFLVSPECYQKPIQVVECMVMHSSVLVLMYLRKNRIGTFNWQFRRKCCVGHMSSQMHKGEVSLLKKILSLFLKNFI